MQNNVVAQGATISTDDDTGNIVFSRILKGGAADKSGTSHVFATFSGVTYNLLHPKGSRKSDLLKTKFLFSVVTCYLKFYLKHELELC